MLGFGVSGSGFRVVVNEGPSVKKWLSGLARGHYAVSGLQGFRTSGF